MTRYEHVALDVTLDLAAKCRAAVVLLARAITVRRERDALGRLDQRLLRDIGVTDADAQVESQRNLFDLPARDWSERRLGR